MRNSRYSLAFCSLTALAAAVAVPAAAQTAPNEVEDNSRAAAPAAGEIVVTATRRAQNIQDVPVAVTAISESQLRTLNIADTKDLAAIAPTLTFAQGAVTKVTFFTIRGIGSYINSDAFDQSVGIAFDGVPLARPAGSIADLVDLDHVEVLEGPQGMLFGKNASAGLVNIVTKAPVMGARTAEGRLSYGNFNELQASTTVNLPIGDNIAVRGSVWNFRHDGYIDAFRLGRKLGVKNSYGGRLRVKWEPSSSSSLLLTGDWTGADQDPAVTTLRVFSANTAGVRDYELAQGIQPGPENERTSSPFDLYNRSSTSAYTAQFDQDVGSATLTSVTSYRNIHLAENYDPGSTSSPIYVAIQNDNVRYKQFSQEVRLTSGSAQRLRYVVGAIYFDLNLKDKFFSSALGVAAVPISVDVYPEMKSKHYGLFGELTYDITDNLRAIAGGRISHDKITGSLDRVYHDQPTQIVAGVNSPGASFGPISLESGVKATEPSYRFGLQYDLAPDVMVYATASRGYKAPGLDLNWSTAQTVFNATRLQVKPEIAKNYEIGFRSQFFDRKLTLNVTAWHEVFSNFQTTLRLPAATILSVTKNAAEMRSDGVAATLTATLPAGFTLSGSAAYVNARYTDFKDAACYPGEPTAPAGSPKVPGVCVGGLQSMDGQRLANSPKYSGNATLRWDGQVGEIPVFAQVNYRAQSKVVFNAVADPRERQGGYSLVNLAGGFRLSDDRVGVSFYAKNIFDKKFVSRTVAQLSGAYFSQTTLYEARATYGVALDFKF